MTDRLVLSAARQQFPPVRGYLDAATLGLPALATRQALLDAVEQWAAGRAEPAAYDLAVARSRQSFAALVGVPADLVAIGPQVSVLVAVVASTLPDGAEVLTYSGEFASVAFPFLVHADRGVRVRQVPLAALADEVSDSTACVAFSLVQSATGEVADAAAIREAAARVGALTVCDTTQATGWLPVRAKDFDVTVCGAYKWLCSPRGTAFLTVSPEALGRLRPLYAGWHAGESVWDSVYGPDMRLAASARRFDVSPAWLPWVGTATALEVFAGLDVSAVRDYDAALADRLRAALGMEPDGRAVVSLPDPDGELRRALEAAGCRVAGRAGLVRLSFHLWNDEDDADAAGEALRPLWR